MNSNRDDLGSNTERLPFQQLASFFDGLTDTYYRTDAAGLIIYASEAAEKLLGYGVDELIGMKLSDFYVEPDGREKFIATLQSQGGSVSDYEAELKHRDGGVISVSTSSRFIYDEANNVCGVEGIARNVTRRARDREDQRQMLFGNEAVGAAYLNLDGTIIEANASFHHMLGYETGELNGKSVLDYTHPDDVQANLDWWQNIVTTDDKIHQFEKRYLGKQGNEIWGKIFTRTIRDLEGQPIHLICQVEDVTRHKAAELAAKNNEIYLSSIFENSAEGFVTIDGEGSIERVNPHAEKLFGYSADELIGENVSLLLPADERKQHDQFLSASKIHAPRIINRARDLQGLRKNGSVFPLALTISPMEIGDEKKYIGIIRDITDRKNAEAELRVSKMRLETSQEFANIGTWDWNIQTGDLYWSSRIAPLFGYQEEEVETTYENFLNAVHPDDRQYVMDSVNACVDMGAVYDIEHRVVWEDGSVKWLSEKGDVTRDSDGTPLRMLGVVQDITQRKDFEDQLEMAREAAEQANHAKSEFLSSMSHELRTPMNAILGFGQLLEEDPTRSLSDLQKEQLGLIMTGGRQLLGLINQLLELSKIEAGSVDFALEDLALEAIIDECLSMVQTQADIHQIELVFTAPDPALPLVRTDPARLRQILLNLLSNAIKYNRENGSVTVTSEPAGPGVLRINVADTGFGISKQQQEKLFEPFNRLGRESGDIEGTGIGLTISKQLVEAIGGQIGVTSKEGAGTTFWIALPISV